MSTLWDRLGSRVKRAGRSEEKPDEHGFRAIARLTELLPLATAVTTEIDQEIIRAREQGAPWAYLGAILGMSKQGAQHRYRIAMTRTGKATHCGTVARTMGELAVKPD